MPTVIGDQSGAAETGDEDPAVVQLQPVGEHGHGAGLQLGPALPGILGAVEMTAQTK